MLDFRLITLFCLEKRLSKHKMTIYSKNVGGHGPSGLPPVYAYAHRDSCTSMMREYHQHA